MMPGLPLLLSGSLVTIEISVLSGLLALAAAGLAGIARQSARRALRWPAALYIETFRGTALLIQLFWMYYVLPDFGVDLPAFAVAVLAIGLNYGAYGAEVVRGAMAAVGSGQREAARALGLSPAQTVRLVVLPQAAAIAVLPWGNLMVQLVKATSLVSLITIAELSYRGVPAQPGHHADDRHFRRGAGAVFRHHPGRRGGHALGGCRHRALALGRRMTEAWDWAAAGAAVPPLLHALVTTLLAGVTGFALALVLGLPLALARDARRRAIRLPVGAGVEFIRGTPLLIQVYFLYFTLPAAGLVLPALLTGVVALGLHYATYVSEVYRAGLRSVGRGQRDAAAALGLRPGTVFRHVVLPQALPPIFPALGNYALAILKETPILASISVAELLERAKLIGADTFRYTEPMTLVGLIFLVVSLAGAAGLRVVERRLRPP